MNKSSIYFSITITFITLFLFILISFGVLYKGSEKREKFFNKQRTLDIVHMILKEIKREKTITHDLEEHLREMHLTVLKEKQKILRDVNKQVYWMKKKKNIFINSFTLNDTKYIYIKHHRIDILLLDANERDNFRVYIFLILISLLIAFTFLYFNTIKKLKPLSQLKDKVKNFGEEEFDIECASDKKDEISQLANEFDKSARRLKKIKESRNVFIRNIMHELKTPIAKGHFLTQLPHTEENTQKMQKVFYRLESLINEFASIEELLSTKQEIEKKEYYLSDIIDNASDLLMSSDASIVKEFDNIQLNVDFKLFSIAVKNLMDNAIKYSPEKRVLISTIGNVLIFQNKGKELLHPLDDYFEAFFKEDALQSSQGFGLGLYIVKHILDANNMDLEYEYIKGVNSFKVVKK